MNAKIGKRTIGLDMHPDLFSAAALRGENPVEAKIEWVHDRRKVADLELWARKHLHKDDVVVLEASGNSFEVAERLHKCGYQAVILESALASKIKDNFCNDDKHSAMKLARVYLSGLSKVVWQPTRECRDHREILFAYRNAVTDSTRCRNRVKTFLNEHCLRLKPGTTLTKPGTLATLLALKPWTELQRELLTERVEQLKSSEELRKKLERIMIRELASRPAWSRLWRLLGVRHRVAFGMMAIIGDIERFPTAKKLSGYFGLAPRKQQSGNDAKGVDLGLGHNGRADVRSLLIQSAHNAIVQKDSPLHKWAWKLMMTKSRQEVVVAVARKLTVAIWYLLSNRFSQLEELTDHLHTKLLKLATTLGSDQLRLAGFSSREEWVAQQFHLLKLSP